MRGIAANSVPESGRLVTPANVTENLLIAGSLGSEIAMMTIGEPVGTSVIKHNARRNVCRPSIVANRLGQLLNIIQVGFLAKLQAIPLDVVTQNESNIGHQHTELSHRRGNGWGVRRRCGTARPEIGADQAPSIRKMSDGEISINGNDPTGVGWACKQNAIPQFKTGRFPHLRPLPVLPSPFSQESAHHAGADASHLRYHTVGILRITLVGSQYIPPLFPVGSPRVKNRARDGNGLNLRHVTPNFRTNEEVIWGDTWRWCATMCLPIGA